MTNPTLDSQAAIPPLANTNSFAQATVSPEFDESLTEKNLDMVRNILFGEQARETEKRQIMLERFVKVWTSSIREEMRKNLDALQSEVRLLKDLLAEENKARLGDIASLCSTCTKQKFKIGGINRLFSLIQLIRPLPHNLTVAILRFYHNPIFL